MQVRRGGAWSQGPVVACEVTGEEESDGGEALHLLLSNGNVAAQGGEVHLLERSH